MSRFRSGRSRLASVAVLAAGTLSVGVFQAGTAVAAPAPAHRAGSVGRAHHAGPSARILAMERATERGISTKAALANPATPYQDSTPYYEVSRTGAVWPLGGATPYGQMNAGALHTRVVGVAMTPDRGGYWLVTAAGGVYDFGDAGWFGSPLNSKRSMVPSGIVAAPDGRGYWVYDRRGAVAAFGDARGHGQLGDQRATAPVVDMVATPDGQGYWMVTSNGEVASFGSAHWHGGEGRRRLRQPIVSMASTPDGRGYWLLGFRGSVYQKGDAAFEGSLGRHPINQPIASILPTSSGRGYWLVAHDGDIHPYGDAASSSPPVTAFVHTIRNAGDRAMEWAMAQLGKPYQWGGTGPNSFDCSGLTMMSWNSAHVVIPRIADEQYIDEPHLPVPDLVDGDLVFYESDSNPTSIYHVAMYMGGGHEVAAPYTGQVVRSEWMGGYGFVSDGAAP